MTKKFALLFALLVMPAFGFAQDAAAPPAPVPVPESAAAVVVGQGCTNCGAQAATGCNSCGTASSCDPCARPARARVFTRRNACCQPAATCCTPAPAPCCNTAVANDCCAPATRTRLLARRSNCCETATACASPCATIAPASTDCGCSSVATVAASAAVVQVSYVSECNGVSARPGLRPFAGTVLRRTR